jgi:hypothetical protein
MKGDYCAARLVRIVNDPLREMPGIALRLTQSILRPGGAAWRDRLAGLRTVMASVLSTKRDPRRDAANDPVARARATLQSDPRRLQELEDRVEKEISNVLSSALAEVPS